MLSKKKSSEGLVINYGEGGYITVLGTCEDLTIRGPLTLKFDRVTQPFLKMDMRYKAYSHGKNISDMTCHRKKWGLES